MRAAMGILAVSLTVASMHDCLCEAAPPAEGLVGHWRLDEGTGTTARDSSGRAHHGTLVDGPHWVTGRGGGHALAFDGKDDLSNMRTVERYPFTFTAWIRTSYEEHRETTVVIQENTANSSQRVQLCLSGSSEPERRSPRSSCRRGRQP